MPIVPVTNGSTITTAGIAAMHEAVRGDVNAVLNRYLGRGTFNHVQLDSIAVAAGYAKQKPPAVDVDKEVTTSELTPPDLTSSTLTEVLSYTPGFGTLPPCYVLLFANMSIKGWGSSTGIEYMRHLAIGALSVSIGGAAHNFPNGLTDQGVCRMRPGRAGSNLEDYSDDQIGKIANETVSHMSFASLYDGTAGSFTLSNIKLWAAACEGGSTQALGSTPYFTVPHASISVLAFRKV